MKYLIAGTTTVILELVIVVVLYFVFHGQVSAQASESKELSAKLSSRGFPEVSQKSSIDKDVLQRQLAVLEGVSRSDKAYVKIIGEVASLLPHGAWLSGLSFNRTKGVISGEAINDAAIQELLNGIRGAQIFSHVQLKSAFVRHEKMGSIFQFQIDGTMKGGSHGNK